MKRGFRWASVLIGTLGLLGATMGGAWAYRAATNDGAGVELPSVVAPAGQAVESRPQDVFPVRVTAVEVAPPVTYRASGTTRSEAHAILSFPLGGRLSERTVEIGQRVKADEVLARLEPSAFQNGVLAATAARDELSERLAQAERDLERARQLYERGVITQSSLEQTETRHRALVAGNSQARARVQDAERALRDSVLRAPYDGEVSQVLIEEREFAGPGQPVLVLSGAGKSEVEVALPEGYEQRLSGQLEVLVDLPLVGRSALVAEVIHRGTAAERTGGLFPVVVQLAADDVTSGLSAEVLFRAPSQGGLAVPTAAVVNRTGKSPHVLRVRTEGGQDVAEAVSVQLLDLRGGRVVIEGDSLAFGDRVITEGHSQLSPGDAVRVL